MDMRSTKDLKDIVSDVRGKVKNNGIAGSDYESSPYDEPNSTKPSWANKFGSSTDLTKQEPSKEDKATISKL